MEEVNQDLNNTINEPTINQEIPKSQRGLVVVLSVLVIVLLSAVIYLLIKEEIVQVPFLNKDENSSEIVVEEATKEGSVDDLKLMEYKATEDGESSEESKESEDEKDLANSLEEEKAGVVDTSDWLIYHLDNPKLTFRYPPSGYTVTLVPTNNEEFIHLQISGAGESFNYYISYGEGGPGVGTSGEIKPPESITMIGKFLEGDIYEIKNGEFYEYFPYIEKCSICLAEEGYSPGCPCTSPDNYKYSSMFDKNLEWVSVGEKESFITIEVEGTMSDYDKDIYEKILLSFQRT